MEILPVHPRSNAHAKGRQRLPAWLRRRVGDYDAVHLMKKRLRQRSLHTVCEEASCPNLGECWSAGTATFMILGDVCTRHCGFCDVKAGQPLPPDPNEPEKVADMVRILELKHVVITCVARDDLIDGGAAHFADCIHAVREESPETYVEVLTTDFGLNAEAIDEVLVARPDVFNHNIETVERLSARVRHRANYQDSLRFLDYIKTKGQKQQTKSGLMLGLGEKKSEVLQALHDLRAVSCDIITIGQYLRPSQRNLPVSEYIPPEQFREYEEEAYAMGFRSVASGPFVRSSYHAETMTPPKA